MSNSRPDNFQEEKHDFGFIAGTLFGIGVGIWAARDNLTTVSQNTLKKFLREYTETIPDHVDHLVDQIYTETFYKSLPPSHTEIKSKVIKPKNKWLTKLKQILLFSSNGNIRQ